MDHELLFQAGETFKDECGDKYVVHGYYFYGECSKPVYYIQDLADGSTMEVWIDAYDGEYSIDRAD